MASKTNTFPHPEPGIPDLRVNVLAALFDLKTGDVFVGDLLWREDDKREYKASMVEGGVDKGQTIADAFAAEIKQETGFTDATLLAVRKQSTVCFFEDCCETNPPPKYSGKVFAVAAFGIDDIKKLDLDSGADSEGPTFARSSRFMPLKEAETYLLKREITSSELRRNFTQDIISQLQPVADALAVVRVQAAPDINSRAILAAMPPEKATLFSDHIPIVLPAPDAASLALPRARRSERGTALTAETLVAK